MFAKVMMVDLSVSQDKLRRENARAHSLLLRPADEVDWTMWGRLYFDRESDAVEV